MPHLNVALVAASFAADGRGDALRLVGAFHDPQVLNVSLNSLRVFGPALTFVAIDWLVDRRTVSTGRQLVMAGES